MATGEPDRHGSPSAVTERPPNAARRLQRVGLVVALVAAVPTLVAGAAVLARSGGTGVLAAMTAGGAGGAGVAFVFRVAMVVAAAGCWCVGLGLLVEGLFDPDA